MKIGFRSREAVLTLSFVVLLAQAFSAQQKLSEVERRLWGSVNRERAARQLPVLKWDEGLARAARKHAERMAEENLLLHQLPGEPDLATRAHEVGATFRHITENIAMGVDDNEFHDGWMRSPGHRANILDVHIDSIGIAVVDDGAHLFAVEDFAEAVPPLSIEEQERQVGILLAERGLRLVKIGRDAEESCKLDHDFAGRSKPRYIAHYEPPNITKLPENLEREIQSGHYKSAAVGACSPQSALASFRIVVLLY